MKTNIPKLSALLRSYEAGRQEALKEVVEKAEGMKKDTQPLEDGIPVEAYAHEEPHDAALSRVISWAEQEVGKIKE